MTYPELISRLYDLQRLATVPEAGERSGNSTSFDRNAQYDPATDTYIDWGANDDGSGMIRMEGADAVVAELEGPGVIWRVWSANPEQGHIQIYIDGSDTPALDMPFADYVNNREGMFAYHCTAYWYQQAGESDPYGPVGLEDRFVSALG